MLVTLRRLSLMQVLAAPSVGRYPLREVLHGFRLQHGISSRTLRRDLAALRAEWATRPPRCPACRQPIAVVARLERRGKRRPPSPPPPSPPTTPTAAPPRHAGAGAGAGAGESDQPSSKHGPVRGTKDVPFAFAKPTPPAVDGWVLVKLYRLAVIMSVPEPFRSELEARVRGWLRRLLMGDEVYGLRL